MNTSRKCTKSSYNSLSTLANRYNDLVEVPPDLVDIPEKKVNSMGKKENVAMDNFKTPLGDNRPGDVIYDCIKDNSEVDWFEEDVRMDMMPH